MTHEQFIELYVKAEVGNNTEIENNGSKRILQNFERVHA